LASSSSPQAPQAKWLYLMDTALIYGQAGVKMVIAHEGASTLVAMET